MKKGIQEYYNQISGINNYVSQIRHKQNFLYKLDLSKVSCAQLINGITLSNIFQANYYKESK